MVFPLRLTRLVFTSPGKSANKTADPGAMSNHTVCVECCYTVGCRMSGFGNTETHSLKKAKLQRPKPQHDNQNCSRRYRSLVAPWSQQDGTTAHTARGTLDSVTAVLPGHVTSRTGDIAWPASHHVLHILRVRI